MARIAGSGHQAGGCAARGRLSVPGRRNDIAVERDTTMSSSADPQAARLTIDYPDRDLDRVSTALRLVYAIPVMIVLGGVAGGVAGDTAGETGGRIGAFGGGMLVLPVLLMIVFRNKYPRWWFDFNLQLARFSTRVLSYLALMSDRYPSTDDEQSVHLDLDYPNVSEDLNRWLPLVKWLLAVPHYVALLFLGVAAAIGVAIAWFSVLFTGRYPRAIFGFVEGVLRWALRVEAYAFLLVTDRYPPFSLA
jgi:hypothetical protein